ncbi:MAG: tetratricopeptide repeat protein [Saprospiraceae bacterium]
MTTNHFQNSKNIIHDARIDAKGNVFVGDNIVINLKEAAQYIAIEKAIEKLNQDFQKKQEKIKKYPNDEDFQIELLQIDKQRSEKHKELETLKTQVIELAVKFTTIPINTERLRKAKAHFEKGEFAEARAIFEVEKNIMNSELETAIHKGELGENLVKQSKEERAKLANEYLLFAQLTAIDFDLKDKFERTIECFELSLKADRNGKNIFTYSIFLQKHNKNDKSRILYEESLGIYRELAKVNQQTYLPYVAGMLNNLGILQSDENEFIKAEKSYNEALTIRKQLVKLNKKFYSCVASTLNNLATLQNDKKEFIKAEKSYKEALAIYQKLSQGNQQTYSHNIGMILNNIAILQSNKNEFTNAEKSYQEALLLYRKLAKIDKKIYLPQVATTLNNLGTLQEKINEFTNAEKSYQEALIIRKQLADLNHQTYLPHVATTQINLAIFYFESKVDKEKSFQYIDNAIDNLLPFYQIRSIQNHLTTAFQILQALDMKINMEEYLQEKINNPS